MYKYKHLVKWIDDNLPLLSNGTFKYSYATKCYWIIYGLTHFPICPVCKSSLCISNTGKVYPCEGWQELILGDLSSNSLREIWNSTTKVNHLRNLKYKDFSKCVSCSIKEYCNPCLIMNANDNPNGDFMKVNNYLCEVAKLRKEAMLQLHR